MPLKHGLGITLCEEPELFVHTCIHVKIKFSVAGQV